MKKKNLEQSSGEPLNKFIAQAGICSRRKAAELVKDGRVTVNGKVVVEPGFKVVYADVVKVGTQYIRHEEKAYILLNKPKDYITTASDEKGRRTVLDLIKPSVKERVYPIGRLDRKTTGLLLLTNDGDLAQKLAHPRYEVSKIYYVILTKPLMYQDVEKIKKGVKLSDGVVKVDSLSFVPGEHKNHVRITVHSGKYRVIRRLFEELEYEVDSLDRVNYAGLTKKGLTVGKWRFLNKKEVQLLKKFGAIKE